MKIEQLLLYVEKDYGKNHYYYKLLKDKQSKQNIKQTIQKRINVIFETIEILNYTKQLCLECIEYEIDVSLNKSEILKIEKEIVNKKIEIEKLIKELNPSYTCKIINFIKNIFA